MKINIMLNYITCMKKQELILCACGCGNTMNKYDERGYEHSFISKHQNRGRTSKLKGIKKKIESVMEFIYCKCGCGKTRSKYNSRKQIAKYIKGHHPHGFEKGHEQDNSYKKGNKFAWKGGKTVTTQGYVQIYSQDHPYRTSAGYVMEHRLIMEKKIGRYLVPNIEDVHHKNGIPDDNRLENLVMISHRHHSKITNNQRKKVSIY